MLEFVHLHDRVETLLEGITVCGESNDGENDSGVFVIAYSEYFGYVTGVDAVTRCRSGVACEDSKVCTGNS